jgi:uncharacterized membrane protein YeaQ/YmgE (transglycosylase-associated protein family)
MIGHMLFGLVVGIVAKLLIPGHRPGGIIATMVIGILGAWLGGLLGRALGMYPEGHPAGFLMALVGAILVLLAYGFITRPSTTSVGLTGGNQYVQAVGDAVRAGIMRAA